MELRKILQERARIIASIRRFFSGRNYLEVETPHLASTPIPERYIELFRTTLLRPDYRTDRVYEDDLYLLPSPEYYLKQLLAAGIGDLFEIAHAFRNYESTSAVHSPEFTMLEWYTVNADSTESLALTVNLLQDLGVSGEPLVLTVSDAFGLYADIDLPACRDRDSLARACGRIGIDVQQTESWEELFQRAFLTRVEPALPAERPVFLTAYPAAISTLARSDGTWAQRWELYLGGIETANCYTEETNPEVIARFLTTEAQHKRQSSLVTHPAPKDFLSPPNRLPECSGVALGVDRLVMHLTGATSISEVISFPLSATMHAQFRNNEE